MSLLATSDLFKESTFASVLTPHGNWCQSVRALESEHHLVFDMVCQRILGDSFGMFEAALFAPRTTTRTKF
jgi:hypothetical protein